MFTTKQQESLEHVAAVFEFFFEKAYHVNGMVHNALHVAGKLTQVYFDNYYKDGTSK